MRRWWVVVLAFVVVVVAAVGFVMYESGWLGEVFTKLGTSKYQRVVVNPACFHLVSATLPSPVTATARTMRRA